MPTIDPLTGFMGSARGGSGYSLPSTAVGAPYSANMGGGVPRNIADITNLVNELNLTAQRNANNARIPGAADLESQSSNMISSQLQGQIPPDVLRLVQQQAAERAAAGGYGGSPNDNAAYLRALGITSLDLQNQGQKNLSAALDRNPAAKTFDPGGLIVTPAQQAQLNLDAARLNSDNTFRQGQLDLERWQAQNKYWQDRATWDRAYGKKEYGTGTVDPVTGQTNWRTHYWA